MKEGGKGRGKGEEGGRGPFNVGAAMASAMDFGWKGVRGGGRK